MGITDSTPLEPREDGRAGATELMRLASGPLPSEDVDAFIRELGALLKHPDLHPQVRARVQDRMNRAMAAAIDF